MILDPHFTSNSAEVTHKNQTIYTIHLNYSGTKATGYEYNGVQFPRRPKDIAKLQTFLLIENRNPSQFMGPIILKAINTSKPRQIRTIQTLQMIEMSWMKFLSSFSFLSIIWDRQSEELAQETQENAIFQQFVEMVHFQQIIFLLRDYCF
jgi:hypothetical protein